MQASFWCLHQKQPSEVFYKKWCSSKFRKCHRKTPVLESFLMKFQAWRSTTLLKRDSNTVIFLWNLRHFEEHLFWGTSANGCFCFVSWEKQLLLKWNFGKVNHIWPGRTNHLPWYKKCHNFRKVNGIDLKFYDFF